MPFIKREKIAEQEWRRKIGIRMKAQGEVYDRSEHDRGERERRRLRSVEIAEELDRRRALREESYAKHNQGGDMQERDRGAAAGWPTAAWHQVPLETQKAYYDKDAGKWVMPPRRTGEEVRIDQKTWISAEVFTHYHPPGGEMELKPELMARVDVSALGERVVELKSYNKVLEWRRGTFSKKDIAEMGDKFGQWAELEDMNSKGKLSPGQCAVCGGFSASGRMCVFSPKDQEALFPDLNNWEHPASPSRNNIGMDCARWVSAQRATAMWAKTLDVVDFITGKAKAKGGVGMPSSHVAFLSKFTDFVKNDTTFCEMEVVMDEQEIRKTPPRPRALVRLGPYRLQHAARVYRAAAGAAWQRRAEAVASTSSSAPSGQTWTASFSPTPSQEAGSQPEGDAEEKVEARETDHRAMEGCEMDQKAAEDGVVTERRSVDGGGGWEMPTPPPTVPLSGSEAGEEEVVSPESESSSGSDSSASNKSTNDDAGEGQDAAVADPPGQPERNGDVGQEEQQAGPAAEPPNPMDDEEEDEQSSESSESSAWEQEEAEPRDRRLFGPTMQAPAGNSIPRRGHGLELGYVPGYPPSDWGEGGPPGRPDDAEAIDEGGRFEKFRAECRLDMLPQNIEGVKKRIAHVQLGACDLKILLHFAAEWVSPPIVVSVYGDLLGALEVGWPVPGKTYLGESWGIHRLAAGVRLWRRGCYDSGVDGTNRFMEKCPIKERGPERNRTTMFAVVRDTDSRSEQRYHMDDCVPDSRWKSWSIVFIMGPDEEVTGGRRDAAELIRAIIAAAQRAEVVLEFKMNQAMVHRGAEEFGIVPEMDDSINENGRGSASTKVFHRNVTLVSTHFDNAGCRITDIVMYQPMLLRVLRDLLEKASHKPWKFTDRNHSGYAPLPKKVKRIVACCVELSLTVPWMGTFSIRMLERWEQGKEAWSYVSALIGMVGGGYMRNRGEVYGITPCCTTFQSDKKEANLSKISRDGHPFILVVGTGPHTILPGQAKCKEGVRRCEVCMTNVCFVSCANSTSTISVKHLSYKWRQGDGDQPVDPERPEDAGARRTIAEIDVKVSRIIGSFKSDMVDSELMRAEDSVRVFFHPEMYGVVEALIMDQETGQVRPDLAKKTKWMCLGCKDGQGYRMQRAAYDDIKNQVIGDVHASGWWATVAAGNAGPPRRVRRPRQANQPVVATAHACTRAQPLVPMTGDNFDDEYDAYCWFPDYKGVQMMGPRLVEHHGEFFAEVVQEQQTQLQKFPQDPEGQVRAWALDRARNVRSQDYPRQDLEDNVIWGLATTDAHYKYDAVGDVYDARLKLKMETTSEQPTDEELGAVVSDGETPTNRDDLPDLVPPSSASDSDDDGQPGVMMNELREAVGGLGENQEDLRQELEDRRNELLRMETERLDERRQIVIETRWLEAERLRLETERRLRQEAEAQGAGELAAERGGRIVYTAHLEGEPARQAHERGVVAAVDVHMMDEHNQMRSEAEVLAAVRYNLIAHIGMVDAKIATLEERNDLVPAAGGGAGQPGPAAADGGAGQPGPAGGGGDVIMGDDIPGEMQNR
jgi:hypothetical protein